VATPALRPLSFGEILDGAFVLYRRHFRELFLTAFIPFVPLLVIGLFLLVAVLTAPPETGSILVDGSAILAIVYGFAAALWVWTGLAHLFSAAVLGESMGWRVALRAGRACVLPVIGAVLISWMILGVAMAVGGALAFAFSLLLLVILPGGAGALGAVVITFTLTVLLVILPAAIIFVSLSLSLPIIVTENLRVVESIVRAWRLMAGARMRGLGLWFVGWLIVLVPSLILFGFFAAIFGIGAVMGLDESEGAAAISRILSQLVQPFVGALTTPFTVALLVILYFDRRVRVEGLDLELADAEMGWDDEEETLGAETETEGT